MTDDERRANFRRLEACTADFHIFRAAGFQEPHFVQCSECGGVVTRLAGNFYYYGVRAGFDTAARLAQKEVQDIKALRQRMQADFRE